MRRESRSHIAPWPILIILGLMALTSAPTRARSQGLARAPLPPRPGEPVVVRLHGENAGHLNAVAGELDIWEAHLKDRFVVAAVTLAQYEWLEGLGYRLEIDPDKTTALGIRAALDPLFYYYDYYHPNAQGRYVVDFLYDINAAYPDLTELHDIGDAWLADQPGEYDRDIWVLRITNEDPIYGRVIDKPAFFLFATIHAREVAVSELAIRYIKYLTSGYSGAGGFGADPDVTWLVNHHVAYVLVMQNPDGHAENEPETSANRRKNMDWDDGCSDPWDWGVDLNRNHSFMWGCCGGSSGDPCAVTYRGPVRGSEPETQAFEHYFATVMLDQNGPNGDSTVPEAAPEDTAGIFITLHSYGDLVLWPWGWTSTLAPNDAALRAISRKFAYYNGYDPTDDFYIVDGATDDWVYGKFGIPAFTFEVGPSSGSCGGFFPLYGCIDGSEQLRRSFWAENRPAFLYAHKIARTPYRTAYGPDTEDVMVVPDEVPPGEPLQLTATLADHRLPGDLVQPIAAAEYFVDLPGGDGTGFPLGPIDGTWGGLNEGVIATVDTAGLSLGRHYLLVHGLNENGKWGPFTAVFLDVGNPGDLDNDGVVGLGDYAVFAVCLGGPGQTAPPSACPADRFSRTDLDDDLDVDASDFAIFQSLLAE